LSNNIGVEQIYPRSTLCSKSSILIDKWGNGASFNKMVRTNGNLEYLWGLYAPIKD